MDKLILTDRLQIDKLIHEGLNVDQKTANVD